MRLRQEIQEMLRAQLIAIAALTGGLLCLTNSALSIVALAGL